MFTFYLYNITSHNVYFYTLRIKFKFKIALKSLENYNTRLNTA